MRRFAQLLRESAAFALTREHWTNSLPLIGAAIMLMIIGREMDFILEADGVLSNITDLLSTYLTLVVFPIGWYRAIGTTGQVRMDYWLSIRTWHYIAGFLKIAALLILLGAAIFAIWAIAGFELPNRGDVNPTSIWLTVLVLSYGGVRFGFIFPAAANDRPITLGDALDASSGIQWPLLGVTLTFQLVGALADFAIPDSQDMSRPLTYVISVVNDLLLLVIQGFTAAATGIAYKQVSDPTARSSIT